MSLISEKITKDIQDQKIEPRPRWYFLFKNYGILTLFVLSIVCGAAAVSTILFMIVDYDRDIARYLDRSELKDIILSVPYFWIIILIIFLSAAYYNFKKSYTGYRYELYKVFLISFALSVILGVGLYYGGLDSQIDEFLSQRIPLYENFIYNKDDVWVSPEQGLLSGRVVEVGEVDKFVLEDFNGKVWQVEEIKTDESNFPKIRKDLELKLIGKKTGDNTFDAENIRPWKNNGRRN